MCSVLALWCSAFVLAPRQEITWQPLAVQRDDGAAVAGAFQGTLEVPMDRSLADGKRIQLSVAKLEGKKGGVPLIHLHGGPGGQATGYVTSPMWEPLRELGDVILLDQRGCGRSTPALYLEGPKEGVAEDVFQSQAGLVAYLEKASRLTLASLKEKGVDPRAFHNYESVADLEDLRRALGVERVNVLGFSYGSHLGLLWLREHPESIANAVLIGVEGFEMTQKLPESYDVHWRRLALRAERDPALAESEVDIVELLPRALAEVEKEPLVVRSPDPITRAEKDYLVGRDGLLLLVVLDIGDSSDIPVLPRLLHEVTERRTSMLAWFLRKRLGLVAHLPVALFTMDAGAGITAARELAIRDQSRTSVFGSAMNFEFDSLNELWNPVRFGADYCAPHASPVRTLFVSGELDSNTPPYQAEMVRFGFSDAQHLIARNAGHEASWLGNDRAIAAIRDFLAGKDVTGRDIDQPKLRFAALEGPTDVDHPALDQ